MKIVFVGLAGVPFMNRAIDVRLGSFADLLNKCGYTVEIVNRFSPYKNTLESSYIIYEPFRRYSSPNIVLRTFLYFLSLLVEPLYIIKSHSKEKIDVLFTSTGHFIDFIVYKLICRLIGAKMVNQYCEARSSFEKKNLYSRINGYLVDNIAPKLWDGAICISHFLQESCTNVNRGLITTIVYPLCDFTLFDQCKVVNTHRYILFCGSIGYRETIDFILKSYRMSKMYEKVNLLMILAGANSELEKFKYDNIDVEVETNLAYNELINRYKAAEALLIPMRNNIRDIARFPNKTCEYCASRGLIVTTDVGEISYVFKDGTNALVAKHYNVDEYANKLNWILDNRDSVDKIKDHCYDTGLHYFSIMAYQDNMKSFFDRIKRI